MNIKQTKFTYAGLDRPQHLRVLNFEYTTVSGHTAPALLVEANSVVILQTGWEERYTFQTAGTQGDGNYVSVVETQPDGPIEAALVSFSREDRPWEEGLRTAIDQLVKNRVAHAAAWTPERERVIDEDSERLIAEHVYKALLRQSGYDIE